MVLYGLLCGFLPFDVDSEEDTYLLYQKIKVMNLFKYDFLRRMSELRNLYITRSNKLLILRAFRLEVWINVR